MVAAAARELRRAHSQYCADFGGLWSHGDPHVGNFIYDEARGRARLIDFEVMHHPAMPAEERHADDLLVFIQDMVGRISGELWMPSAMAFLRAYEEPKIIALLRSRLVIPQGLARVWWAVRTTYMAPRELERRIAALRAEI
jgi:aminoglycoside phosphotransferase (APT) family kinase protein